MYDQDEFWGADEREDWDPRGSYSHTVPISSEALSDQVAQLSREVRRLRHQQMRQEFGPEFEAEFRRRKAAAWKFALEARIPLNPAPIHSAEHLEAIELAFLWALHFQFPAWFDPTTLREDVHKVTEVALRRMENLELERPIQYITGGVIRNHMVRELKRRSGGERIRAASSEYGKFEPARGGRPGFWP